MSLNYYAEPPGQSHGKHFVAPTAVYVRRELEAAIQSGARLTLYSLYATTTHWPQNMDGWQRRKIEAKRPPY